MVIQPRPGAFRIAAAVAVALSAGCSSASNPETSTVLDASKGMDSAALDEAAPETEPEDAGLEPDSAGYQVEQGDAARTLAADIPVAEVNEAVAANNAFAIDLYTELLDQTSDAGAANVLTSPLSASLALTMAYGGAQGATATEMAAVLHADLPDGGSIFEGQNALDQALASRGAAALAQAPYGSQGPPPASDYRLQIANAVWGERTIPWLPSYLKLLTQNYGAGLYATDFIHQPARADAIINGWVSDQTDSLITNLIPPQEITSQTVMVLVNALEVKFPWATPFPQYQTGTATFTRASGTTVTPSFMNQTTNLPYTDDGDAQIVEVPMIGSEALLVALPHEGTTLADYEAALAAGDGLVQPTESQLVSLSIPKVALSGETFSLAHVLQGLGMVQAFIPGTANFAGMSTVANVDDFFILDVLQQTALTMQESGLQAAAATAVIIDEDASAEVWGEGGTPTPIPVVVNRPYVIAIVDVPTGTILMLGHIEDPTAQ